ncbi:hypothetical protein AVEN_67391-1 [Araneus ventricosus]|uniref:Uncharacterized protein n=1 Tax=Araneus ventricosus TaxID=182803 RepID=A0A4Y2N079_ARAVE|nr:hypothetical protein AVEN_67391-1 [Araneus ventricosus]
MEGVESRTLLSRNRGFITIDVVESKRRSGTASFTRNRQQKIVETSFKQRYFCHPGYSVQVLLLQRNCLFCDYVTAYYSATGPRWCPSGEEFLVFLL